MPKIITFGDFQLEVDQQKTAQIYKRMLFWCMCDFCTNAKITQRTYIPKAQIELLENLGVDPWRPCLTEFSGRKTFDKPHHTRRTSCWFLYGKIISLGQPAKTMTLDKWNWIWADSQQSALSAYDGVLDDIEKDKGLIYIFASNEMPWFYDEVSGFKNTIELDCLNCGRTNQVVGFLKRKSLIPVWISKPHLSEFVQCRKSRLAVSFCLKCGLQEFRIIPRKPRVPMNGVISHWDSFTDPQAPTTEPPR